MVVSAVLVIALIKISVTIPQIYLLVGVLNLFITGVIFIIFPEYIQRLILIISGRREQSLE